MLSQELDCFESQNHHQITDNAEVRTVGNQKVLGDFQGIEAGEEQAEW